MRRIEHGPEPGAVPVMADRVQFSGDVEAVVERVKSVLLAVLGRARDWPDDELWPSLLPAWFVSACAPQLSDKAAGDWLARWRRLPAPEQARIAEQEPWSLSNWLYWFNPDEGGADRGWRWWSSGSNGDGTGWLDVEIAGAPYASGVLRWLLRAAGATAIR